MDLTAPPADSVGRIAGAGRCSMTRLSALIARSLLKMRPNNRDRSGAAT
jgi:hypothetical protein